MAKMMKAAVVREFGKPLYIEDAPIPEPGPGQIQVKIKACGATVVVGRLPWLTSGSGASKATMLPMSWLRFATRG